MSKLRVVEGNASYRRDADLDETAKALTMAEHRMHVAASMAGGRAGVAEMRTFSVDGVVLIRYRARLIPSGSWAGGDRTR
ncbi:hypothetical protein [Cellulosimicrobium sp. Marseille-Q8652]